MEQALGGTKASKWKTVEYRTTEPIFFPKPNELTSKRNKMSKEKH
jgi:hypothetical protein